MSKQNAHGSETRKRTALIQVRLAPDERELIEISAAMARMTPAEWLRTIGLAAAGRDALVADLEVACKTASDLKEAVALEDPHAGWKYDGPNGNDMVEQWTREGCAVMVLRTTDSNGMPRAFTTAWADDGHPAGDTSDYAEYDTLAEAQRAAHELNKNYR